LSCLNGRGVLKRFTDTELWERPWFRKLSPAEKEAFRYIKDKCDNVGVWIPDFETAEFKIGESVDWDTLPDRVNSNIHVLESGKWWIPDFCDFQYGDLSEGSRNNAHISYIKLLKRHGLWPLREPSESPPRPLEEVSEGSPSPLKDPKENSLSPLRGPQEKEKEKEKDKDLEKDKEKEEEEEDARAHENAKYIPLAEKLIGRISQNDPDHFKNKNAEKIALTWANDIRLLVERDGRSPTLVEKVIDWCQSDTFWKTNILSAGSLRKQFAKLMMQMKTDKKARASPQYLNRKVKCPACGRELVGTMAACPRCGLEKGQFKNPKAIREAKELLSRRGNQ